MTNPLFKKRQSRTRHRIATHGTRPRLSVFRSGKHIYAQVIDDTQAVTVASASTNEKDAKGKGYNVEAASSVGKKIAERLCVELGDKMKEFAGDMGGPAAGPSLVDIGKKKTNAEIAQVTGVALGTVKSRLSRARARLREVILASRELSEAAQRLSDRQ